MNITKTILRNKLKVINKRVDNAEKDIMEGMREGTYVSDKIVYRLEKMREAKAIHDKLYN